jgi:hypothetical protein
MEAPVRVEALRLMSALVTGLGPSDRNSASVQADALKAAGKAARDNPDSEALHAVAGLLSPSFRDCWGLFTCI